MLTIQEILTKCRTLEMNFLNLFMLAAVLGSAWFIVHLAKLALLQIAMIIP
jgi:hypothetical protein